MGLFSSGTRLGHTEEVCQRFLLRSASLLSASGHKQQRTIDAIAVISATLSNHLNGNLCSFVFAHEKGEVLSK